MNEKIETLNDKIFIGDWTGKKFTRILFKNVYNFDIFNEYKDVPIVVKYKKDSGQIYLILIINFFFPIQIRFTKYRKTPSS